MNKQQTREKIKEMREKEKDEIKEILFEMLTEETTRAGLQAYTPNWKETECKSQQDLEEADPVDIYEIDPAEDSAGVYVKVSVFHYLPEVLGLDEYCRNFNSNYVPAEDWESDIYGVSEDGQEFIESTAEVVRTFNTYNGEQHLNRTLQGTIIRTKQTDRYETKSGKYAKREYNQDYVLLQTHNGTDVRAGYTDARLFKMEGYIVGNPRVYGEINGHNVSTGYDGITLLNNNGAEIELESREDIDYLQLAEQ